MELQQRLLDLLRAAGPDGLKRSVLAMRLRQRASLSSELFNHCLIHLHTTGYVRSVDVPNRGFGRRGYITYFATDAEGYPPPLPPLEVAASLELPSDLAIPRPPRVSHSGATCAWCGKMLPLQHGGRPRQFCDLTCRSELATAGSTQVGRMFLRADRREHPRIAYYYVLTDLASRGDPSISMRGVLEGYITFQGKRVDVFVARSEAHQDYYQGPINEGAIRAVVYHNGRIRYEPPFDDDASEKDAGGVDDESTPP